jgi:TubC N-terminal docking domain
MTLDALTATLAERGVNLSLRLVVDAPTGALTSEIKTALKAHKPDLVARLALVDVRCDPKPSAPLRVNGAIPWDELALWRWGTAPDPEPGIDPASPRNQTLNQTWGPAPDTEPGIIIDRPDPARRRLALEALDDDPEERAAIRAESRLLED